MEQKHRFLLVIGLFTAVMILGYFSTEPNEFKLEAVILAMILAGASYFFTEEKNGEEIEERFADPLDVYAEVARSKLGQKTGLKEPSSLDWDKDVEFNFYPSGEMRVVTPTRSGNKNTFGFDGRIKTNKKNRMYAKVIGRETKTGFSKYSCKERRLKADIAAKTLADTYGLEKGELMRKLEGAKARGKDPNDDDEE